MFAIYSKRIKWIILILCSLVQQIIVVLVCPYHCYIYLWTCTIFLFQHLAIHHFTISPFYHFIIFAYDLIRNHSGKNSKLIQKYQGYDEALLCHFSKVVFIKGIEVFQVPSWTSSHLLSSNGYVGEPNISLASHFSTRSKWPKIEFKGFSFFCDRPICSYLLGLYWQLFKDGKFITAHEVIWTTYAYIRGSNDFMGCDKFPILK